MVNYENIMGIVGLTNMEFMVIGAMLKQWAWNAIANYRG